MRSARTSNPPRSQLFSLVKIRLCPATRRTRAAAWPRVYAQHLATREIIELHRGDISPSHYVHLTAGFAPAWVTTVCHAVPPLKRIGAQPRRTVNP